MITKKQITTIQWLFKKHRIDVETKQAMIKEFSNHRTTSTKELTLAEANLLISKLSANNATAEGIKKKRSKVLYIAVALGLGNDKGEVDWSKFNSFMLNTSLHRKPLKEYTSEELDQLITQLQQIQKKSNKITATNHKTAESDDITK
jgi:hypothetical protein